ncbi:GNAT family N-acetyltransferase [Mesobacillus jeotgali]|uniref:GNAT family N-acetyltransferase n=1 Tax=Mesobacillus jeotgali TaxID=129985 RepID=A0ABY9VM03_9BACI|nr:GNAT family N-acetyltransferase [Mesobacillus jeotgali]WNF24979.1 GNAT family N-acetyltransferase [Mesobacillus jeotgali]
MDFLLQNGSLSVRRLKEKDKLLLAKWLSDPKVLEYYEGRDQPFDLEKVDSVFYASDDDEVKCMIEYDGIPIGYIQYYELDKVTKREYGYGSEKVFGTDQFIGEVNYWNRGIGTRLVTSMTNFLINQLHADKVIMDPQVWNERAINCYEKCGFKKVKLLPEHELHEGEYRDCWLMEYNNPNLY